MLLVGCKSDLRTDVSTLVELSNHRQTPVSYDQVCVVNVEKTLFKKKKKGESNGILFVVNKMEQLFKR